MTDPLLYIIGFVVVGVVAVIIAPRVWRTYNTTERKRKRENKKLDRQYKQEKKARAEEEKNQAAVAKKLDEVQEQATNPPSVPPVVPIAGGQTANVQSLEEFPIGTKIGWEVTRLVEGLTKRITIVKGEVAIKAGRTGGPPKFMFVKVARAGRTNYYFIDPQRIIKVVTTQGRKKQEVTSYKIVFHEFIAEAMKLDGTIEWSEELEMILADSGMDQYVEIASSDLGFKMTPTLRNALILIGFLGVFIGLALNGSQHFIPTTLIHWVP
jgi:hypothetical protein